MYWRTLKIPGGLGARAPNGSLFHHGAHRGCRHGGKKRRREAQKLFFPEEKTQNLESIALIQFYLAHLTLYIRGSAALGEIETKAALMCMGLNYIGLTHEHSQLDLTAFLKMEPDVFVQEYPIFTDSFE